MVTLRPCATSKRPKDAQMIPFPSEDVTPPGYKNIFGGHAGMSVVDGCKI